MCLDLTEFTISNIELQANAMKNIIVENEGEKVTITKPMDKTVFDFTQFCLKAFSE